MLADGAWGDTDGELFTIPDYAKVKYPHIRLYMGALVYSCGLAVLRCDFTEKAKGVNATKLALEF